MRMSALILTVTMAALLAAPANSREKASPSLKDEVEELAKKIKDLKKERIAVLKELADQASNLFKSGRGSAAEVYEARLLVLQAELDAAEKESERVALCKNIVDVLKEYEMWADGQREAARGTGATVLKVKARRLEAEIGLEQAKAKSAKEGK